jgi:hypothetical protein
MFLAISTSVKPESLSSAEHLARKSFPDLSRGLANAGVETAYTSAMQRTAVFMGGSITLGAVPVLPSCERIVSQMMTRKTLRYAERFPDFYKEDPIRRIS